MKTGEVADLVRAFYAALAAGDRDQLDALLHPEFSGSTAQGMPFGIGGSTIVQPPCVAMLGEPSPGISKRALSETVSLILPTVAYW